MSQSAMMLFTANIFGRHSDTRLIEALGSQPQDVFDYSGQTAISGSTMSPTWAMAGIPTYAIADALPRGRLLDTDSGKRAGDGR